MGHSHSNRTMVRVQRPARGGAKRAGSALVASLALVAAVLGARDGAQVQGSASQPSVILFLVDDMRASDIEAMPNVRHLLAERGTTFPNFTITLPTCCPSRATFLRGQYAHNHLVGHGKPASAIDFQRRGLDNSTVATWAGAAGYRTGYVGKYLNGYRKSDSSYVPPGWDRWAANLNRDVWADVLAYNGRKRKGSAASPDRQLAALGRDFIASTGAGKPFFLIQNFNAPHGFTDGPAAARKADLEDFDGVKSPQTPAFGVVNEGMHPELAGLPPLSDSARHGINVMHRHRLASLSLVDRQIRRTVRELRRLGRLDDTYLFFTTDNGYHMGERRLEGGKLTAQLTDVRAPLIVRGPGVPAGVVRDELVENTDFAPTVAEIAGARAPSFVDGRSIAPLLRGEQPQWRTATLIEGRPQDPTAERQHLGFRGLITTGGEFYVSYWDGFREYYDTNSDPFLLQSLAADPASQARVEALQAHLEALYSCAGAGCREAEGGG